MKDFPKQRSDDIINRIFKLKEIHRSLGNLRNQIKDIRQEDKLWEHFLSICEGGITCVMISLYSAIEYMETHHKKWFSDVIE